MTSCRLQVIFARFYLYFFINIANYSHILWRCCRISIPLSFPNLATFLNMVFLRKLHRTLNFRTRKALRISWFLLCSLIKTLIRFNLTFQYYLRHRPAPSCTLNTHFSIQSKQQFHKWIIWNFVLISLFRMNNIKFLDYCNRLMQSHVKKIICRDYRFRIFEKKSISRKIYIRKHVNLSD